MYQNNVNFITPSKIITEYSWNISKITQFSNIRYLTNIFLYVIFENVSYIFCLSSLYFKVNDIGNTIGTGFNKSLPAKIIKSNNIATGEHEVEKLK